MNALVGKLRSMAEDKTLPIGDAWNALDEAADMIEELSACLGLVESWLAEDPMRTTTEGDWGRVTGHQECAEMLKSVVNRHKPNAHLSGGEAVRSK